MANTERWLCYYGHNRQVLKVPGYRLLVLDADTLGPLTPEDKAGRTCLAYISLGEAEEFRWYWNEVKGAEWVLGKNPNWVGDRLVDPRSEEWRRLVVDRVARRLLLAGYDGFMLDTVDTIETLKQSDPEKFRGVDNGMAKLVADLRAEYPAAVLLPNRGFSILERIGPHVNGILVEGVRSTYDFKAKRSRDLNADEIEWIEAQLDKARLLGLPVFALDYVDPPSPERAERAASELRRAGYRPFISVVKLNTFPGEALKP